MAAQTASVNEASPKAEEPQPASTTDSKLDWQQQKEEQAKQRKKENDLKKCEEQISVLEDKLARLEQQMSDPAIGTQVAKLQEITKEQASVQKQLDDLYEKWELLAQ